MKKSLYKFNVRDITEIAIFSSIAIILDRFIRIPFAATGGSINIALVPIFIIGLRHGWFKCFIAGAFIFGLSTCLLDGYGIACYPLEYFVAYGSICIVGLFSKTIFNQYGLKKSGVVKAILLIILNVVIWGIIRLLVSSLDSVILYNYTFVPALIYNFGYVSLSCLGDGLVLVLLLPVLAIINKTYPTSFLSE